MYQKTCVSLHTKLFYYLSYFLWETCFCIYKWHMLISFYLVQYKYDKFVLKNFPLHCISEPLFVCVDEILAQYKFVKIQLKHFLP